MNLSGLKNDLYNFTVGFSMGTANVIPGVSGGTMLFIMGAFGKLTAAIGTFASVESAKLLFSGQWKKWYERIPVRFFIGLGAGLLAAFATLAKLIVWLLENQQQLTYAFFFGLITASIISVNRQMKKWSIGAAISCLIAALAAFGAISLVPVNGGSQWYMQMLYGAICIIAMILPGLSGSFLLLIFGQYEKVWMAVSNLTRLNFSAGDLSTILFLSLGAVIGMGAFVHLLNYLLKRFYNATIAALIGFMIGAIPRLWPFQAAAANGRLSYLAPEWSASALLVLLCAVAGLITVLVIDYLAGKKTKEKQTDESDSI